MSRLTAKLINRLISEKTCLVALASPRGGVSAPDDELLSGGDTSVASSASPAPVPGNATRLPLGDVRLSALVAGGSISSSVRNDVCSSSGFVLVMVTKKSSRSFCSARGVPFKSIIYKRFGAISHICYGGGGRPCTPFGSWSTTRHLLEGYS